MTAENQASTVYLAIADWYEQQGNGPTRDQFLILAADAAFAAGRTEEANQIHQRIVQANPHHLLKPFQSFETAIRSQFVQAHVAELRQNYPPATVEQMLQLLLTDTNPGGLMDQEPPPANPDQADSGVHQAESNSDRDPAFSQPELHTSHTIEEPIDAPPAPVENIADWGEALVIRPIPDLAECGIQNGQSPTGTPPPISRRPLSTPQLRARSARIELGPASSEPAGDGATQAEPAGAAEPEPKASFDSPSVERSEVLRVYRGSDEPEENEPDASTGPGTSSRPSRSRQKRQKKSSQPAAKKVKSPRSRKPPQSESPKPKSKQAKIPAKPPPLRPLVLPKPYWAAETSAVSHRTPASTFQSRPDSANDDDIPSLGWVSTGLFIVLLVTGFGVLMITVLRFF